MYTNILVKQIENVLNLDTVVTDRLDCILKKNYLKDVAKNERPNKFWVDFAGIKSPFCCYLLQFVSRNILQFTPIGAKCSSFGTDNEHIWYTWKKTRF